jgi:DNA-binding XRE family transcriptional regulator
VRVGCARLSGVHSSVPTFLWARLRGVAAPAEPFVIQRPHSSLITSVCLLFYYCLPVIRLLLNIREKKEATMCTVVYIGDRLREVRTRRLLTQEELAEKSGISPSTVANIERDHREPHFRTIRKLAEALSVDPTELVGH